ncbi:MAG TPA: excinuclease ABC subunit A, partial [Propionibacteriaceae bacterium]|nr:excinuclease ABC subunit A [Propionibacteriaceae bacterium]
MDDVSDRLVVRGAREHNLRNVSLELPRDALIVFTGLSGSGKSSLAFDTIFAEGQRRYVESLSAYARQFLGQMDKPDVDFIEGLSPAVSIDQKSTSRNPRSTVGTITEVYDYLRLMFARIGVPHCPECGAEVSRQTPQQIVDRLLALEEGTRFQVLAPVVRGRKGEYQELFRELATEGLARVRVDGEVHPLTAPPTLDKQRKHDIDVVVDRIAVRPSAKQRLTDSIETALTLAQGVVGIDFVDLDADDPGRERRFSEKMACPNGHDIAIDELEPRQFSFNGPWGACPACSGLGTTMEVDPDLVVPDHSLSLAEGAIQPWASPHVAAHFEHVYESLADEHGFSVHTPWRDLSASVRQHLLLGVRNPVHVQYRNRFGRVRTFTQKYEGILPYVRRRHAEAESDAARERWGAYMREIPCSTCKGTRLRPGSIAVTVSGRNIAEVSDMSIGEAAAFLGGLELSARDRQIAERVVKEINE